MRLLLLLFIFLPSSVFAQEGYPRGWLDPQPKSGKVIEFLYGEEIKIKGENLRGYYSMEYGLPINKEVCLVSAFFSGNRICYRPDSDQVTTWNDNIITVKIPDEIYSETKVNLRFQEMKEECLSLICKDEWKWVPDIETGTFRVRPEIKSIRLKNGPVASAFGKGQSYTIEGHWFGQSQGRIYVDGTEMARYDVVLWLPDSIEIKVTSVSGKDIQVDNGFSKSVSIYLPDQSSSEPLLKPIIPSTSDAIFADIVESHPYFPAIAWGKSSGVLSGYPDGTFKADRAVNRAEFLKIILEANNANVSSATEPLDFPDVENAAWYTPYVRYAKQHSIVEGYPDGTFRPDKAVNFAEALKIAYEALGVHTEAIGDEWYARYLAHAKYNQALFSNTVDVGFDMTRKDVVWLVWRLKMLQQ